MKGIRKIIFVIVFPIFTVFSPLSSYADIKEETVYTVVEDTETHTHLSSYLLLSRVFIIGLGFAALVIIKRRNQYAVA